ncbi:hypothetical protein [Longimicrobium sp.]|uniref:hypothetical protein n=1 Tax=Longimicrobium sp. TaxID=2029185 RepID=UPI002ED933EC
MGRSPGGVNARLWNLVVPPEVADQLAAIGPVGYDWSDIVMSIEWYLTHDPLTVGYATQDAAVRLLVLRRPVGLPGIKVFFAIDGDTVTALRVKSS